MTADEKTIKNLLDLFNLAHIPGNVSEVRRETGFSRGTSYRLEELYEIGGEMALRETHR